MITKIKLILLLILPITAISQNITGKIYDSKTTIKGATIYNTTKNQINHTNENGYFEIVASINDTIIFHSLFHHQKTLIINESYFNETMVIELKKKINELDEILLTNEIKDIIFNEQKYTADIGLQIQNDMKKHPYYYKPSNGNIGNTLNEVSKLIGKLFKSKKKKEPPIITANYKAFDSLFKNDEFFNKKLLVNQLQIKEAYKPLFFDYCDTKQLDKKLFKKENRVILLDSLFNYSKEFLEIVKKSEKK